MKTIIPVLIFLLMVKTRGNEINETTNKNIWNNILKTTGKLLLKYWYLDGEENKFQSDPHILERCVKQVIHDTLDRLLKVDNLHVFTGIDLLKYKIINGSIYRQTNRQSTVDVEKSITDMLTEIGETYLLRISLNTFVTDEENIPKARHRHRRHNMMPLMMFGIVGMGMILVPMGFKFLAVLGGKALLLAKMALILSSIQGLKKVATSNFNYGLYQSPPANSWYYERNGYENVDKSPESFFNGFI